jgi:hypothetical protein
MRLKLHIRHGSPLVVVIKNDAPGGRKPWLLPKLQPAYEGV